MSSTELFYSRALAVAEKMHARAFNRWFEAHDIAADATIKWMKTKDDPTWLVVKWRVIDALRAERRFRGTNGEGRTNTMSEIEAYRKKVFDIDDPIDFEEKDRTSPLEQVEAEQELYGTQASSVDRLREAFSLHGWGEELERLLKWEMHDHFEQGRSFSILVPANIRVLMAVRILRGKKTTQADIAKEARMTRETVSRMISTNRRKGLIRQNGRGCYLLTHDGGRALNTVLVKYESADEKPLASVG